MQRESLLKLRRDDRLEKLARICSALRGRAPRTRRDLGNYLRVFLGIEVPDRAVCPEHCAPMDYLWHAFGADLPAPAAPGRPARAASANADCIVWANRAGGKTELAAVATLLDCVFKPGCRVRILGGSGEQSARMYEYLTAFLRAGFEKYLAGPPLKTRCRFTNGATVEVLTQSATSVRGQHIQKLRCDEVELFNDEVFAAAKFTTQSTAGAVAAMECISTMHRPYGLMNSLVTAAPRLGTPVFKWCLFEVIERCTDRACSRCPLCSDCGGRAKCADGYLKIDDCITQMRRASRAGFEAEMLCRRPSLENVVFAEFDPETHVKSVDYDANLPLWRSLDFGFVNPFVCLWIQVDPAGQVRVIDEYVRSRATIEVHAAEIKRRTPCGEDRVAATFCDPAGSGLNDVTGTSAARELRALGIPTRSRPSAVLDGIELIRRAIRSGDGTSRLVVSPRCPRLIEALQCYHYADSARAAAGAELPLKDGIYDHPVDALRYFFVNHAKPPTTAARRY